MKPACWSFGTLGVSQQYPVSPTYARFERELAYYRADEPYLPVEKCAQRCATLSVLLTAALLDS